MNELSYDELAVDQCPECAERLEPEAESCTACGFALFEREAVDPDPRRASPAEFRDVEDVHVCTMSEGLALRAALGSKGYQVFVADEQTKTIDPFVIGGNAWAVTLRAPVEQAAAVREEIRQGELARRGDHAPVSGFRVLFVIALFAVLAVAAGWIFYELLHLLAPTG